jgi:HEAT repeat protein
MWSAKTIRLVVLLIALAVGGFALFWKHHRTDGAEEISADKEKWFGEGRDVSALTPKAVLGHVKALADKDVAVRQKAAWALWQIGADAKTATPALLVAVKDPVPEMREMAAKALGTVSEGTPDAVPTLVEALQDPQAGVRATAALSLANIWLVDKRPERIEREHREAGGEGDKRPSAATKERDAEEREREREHERERERKGSASDPLVPTLKPQSQPAAKAAIPTLTKILRDRDASVRAAAAKALGETGPLAEPAVGELISFLDKDRTNDERLEACLALGNIGPGAKAAVPALAQSLLHDKALGVRVNTAGALGQIARDPEKAVPALVEACLTDSEPEVRNWCMGSLGRYKSAGPKLAQQTLDALAKDPRNQNAEFQKRAEQFRKTLGKVAESLPAAGPGVSPRSGR